LSFLDKAKADPVKARLFSICLVFVCTLLGAAAQILMKGGTQGQAADTPLALFLEIFSSPQLFAGYALYGISTMLLVVALKYGELSILYPVIGLTYVWVCGLSVLIYGERLNPWKILGLCTVVAGVAILGRASRK